MTTFEAAIVVHDFFHVLFYVFLLRENLSRANDAALLIVDGVELDRNVGL